jgi:hypothetical protein
MPDSEFLVAGRYRLVRQIGSGGMGRVWLAHDDMLHRDVAIKEVILPSGLADDERDDLIQGTLREARAAGRLSHPNVVQVYDVVMYEERPWIVMEYVPSRSLYQAIKADGPLPPRRVAEIGLLVLAALQAAHKARVWHRDVKPGNVLLARDGRVVLTDFGLATFDGDGGVTRSGLILGSAQYISPERARDGVSGPEADLWSLGATLYAAVEGRSPFARDSSMATLTALATQPPDAPRRAGALRPVLLGLLRKNPRHRLTAAQAEKLLRAVASGEAKVRLPRQGAEPVPDAAGGGPEQVARSMVLSGAGSGGGPGSAGGPGSGPGGSGPGAPGPGGAGLGGAGGEGSTATQETYPYPIRRRRWPWLVMAAAVVIGLVGAGAAIALTHRGNGLPTGTAGPTAPATHASTPVVTPQMGVQACAASAPDSGVPVTGTQTIPGLQPWQVPANWLYYDDGGQFGIAVPQGWRVWRLGPLLCFRDPGSVRAAAVLSEGVRAGTTRQLLAAEVPAWVSAADLHNFTTLGTTEKMIGDGPATELEYTYDAGGTSLHGANLLMRAHGDLFLLCWVGADYSWSSEQQLKNVFQSTFVLDS